MKIELFASVRDSYTMKTEKEKLLYITVPILFGALSYIIVRFCFGALFCIKNFLSDYLNAQINVMALFITFSLAYITILVTSSGDNIKVLKERTSKFYTINSKPVRLFQVILADLTCSIIAEIFLLIYSFIQKYLLIVVSNNLNNIILATDIVILSFIFLLLIRNVKNFYFTFWETDGRGRNGEQKN